MVSTANKLGAGGHRNSVGGHMTVYFLVYLITLANGNPTVQLEGVYKTRFECEKALELSWLKSTNLAGDNEIV